MCVGNTAGSSAAPASTHGGTCHEVEVVRGQVFDAGAAARHLAAVADVRIAAIVALDPAGLEPVTEHVEGAVSVEQSQSVPGGCHMNNVVSHVGGLVVGREPE